MRSDTFAPPIEAVRARCDLCNGVGKVAAEWDFLTSAVVAFKVCGSCLGRGEVLVNPDERDAA